MFDKYMICEDEFKNVAEGGKVIHQGVDIVLGNAEDIQRLDRAHRRPARGLTDIQQRHLAKEVTRLEFVEFTGDSIHRLDDLDPSFDDDIEAVAKIPLLKDILARVIVFLNHTISGFRSQLYGVGRQEHAHHPGHSCPHLPVPAGKF